MNNKLIITPKTKIGELLMAYPHLEKKLIELAPEFKKLKNPVLRRTIARVTSLQQAARVGGLSVDTIVNSLRKEAGQENLSLVEEDSSQTSKPEWLDESKIITTFDAGQLIAEGGHPLDKVLRDTHKMNPGELYLLITPFVPAPLIDKVKQQGFEVWSTHENGIHKSYFRKK